MCPTENIPPVDRIENIVRNLERFEQYSDEGRDLYAAEHPFDVASPNSVITAMNDAVNMLDGSRVREGLLNEGRIRIPYELDTDYEGIFENTWLNRRSERQPPLPPGRTQAILMLEWAKMCLDRPEPEADRYFPGDIEAFEFILEHGMPARLDPESWIARILLSRVANLTVYGSEHKLELQEWRPWMGDGEPRSQKHPEDGYELEVLSFLGVARPGRLVWTPPEGTCLPYLEEWIPKYERVRRQLCEAETALIALARRIARQIASCVVFQYAIPEAQRQGRAILDRRQVGRAVREILGDAWFDLPFDGDGKLRNWSEDDILKAEEEMTDEWIFTDDDEDDEDPFTNSTPILEDQGEREMLVL